MSDSVKVTPKKWDTRFQKGEPRPANAGRKKGTPNKLSATVRARLEALGCDPIEGLALMAMDKNEYPSTRSWCYGKLLDRTYSKPAQKLDMSHKIDDIEGFKRRVQEAQGIVVRAKRELEGSANDATRQANGPTNTSG